MYHRPWEAYGLAQVLTEAVQEIHIIFFRSIVDLASVDEFAVTNEFGCEDRVNCYDAHERSEEVLLPRAVA
jgi:hypothetical protein